VGAARGKARGHTKRVMAPQQPRGGRVCFGCCTALKRIILDKLSSSNLEKAHKGIVLSKGKRKEKTISEEIQKKGSCLHEARREFDGRKLRKHHKEDRGYTLGLEKI